MINPHNKQNGCILKNSLTNILFLHRFVWFMRRSSRSIRKSIYLKCSRISGNFQLTHLLNIYGCVLHIWDCRTGNSVSAAQICHHGQSSSFYCLRRIYSNTTAMKHNRTAWRCVLGSQSFTMNWICPFFEQNRNVASQRANSTNKYFDSNENANEVLKVELYKWNLFFGFEYIHWNCMEHFK